ncbi:DUF4421 family protein [Bdellovibrio bacteriovorus]|uniref:Major outer membrane protein n=1 Tax=Bdellovibrio bacteriovorus TaxID=959 RepID=A0A1Z3N6I7_BDEBC|nr:DUF4421 family protein [Bdellovibrio bacteriovorus]ASD63083.1 hypothetical protein B9G79_05625 [Bdellovibrio bacteriovorus]
MFKTLGILILFSASVAWSEAKWDSAGADEVKVTLGPQVSSYQIDIQSPNDGPEAQFMPNVGSKTYLGVSYRNLGASIGLSNPVDPSTVEQKGESSATDFHLRFYGKRTYEFSYQSYKGYYLDNTEAINAGSAPVGIKYQRSDISTRNISFVMHWNLREDDYSLGVAFGQDGHQKESGWSYFASAMISDNKMTGDSPFIPAGTSGFDRLADLQELDRQMAGLGGAVGGIWVRGPWYMTGFAALGVAWQKVYGKFATSANLDESFVGYFSDAKVGGGYNGERHVVDLQLHSDNTTTDFLGGTVDAIQMEMRLTYSYRFQNVDLPGLNSLSSFLD